MSNTRFITTHQKNDVVDKSIQTNILQWMFRQWYVENSSQPKHSQIPKDIITIILPYLARITTNYMPIRQFAKTFPSEFASIKTQCGKRLYKEYFRIIQRGYDHDTESVESILINPNNVRDLRVLIKGPPDTPFAGGVFVLQLFMRKEYPRKPPRTLFRTKMYHPNIDKLGRECLDVTSDKWTPALTIYRVALSIYLLLQDPNPDDPLDNKVAAVWKDDIKRAHEIAKEWTKKYADGTGLMDKEIMEYNRQKEKELQSKQS